MIHHGFLLAQRAYYEAPAAARSAAASARSRSSASSAWSRGATSDDSGEEAP